MHDYICVYEDGFIQRYSVRILANDRDEADYKFMEYLRSKDVSFTEDDIIVIPLCKLEVII